MGRHVALVRCLSLVRLHVLCNAMVCRLALIYHCLYLLEYDDPSASPEPKPATVRMYEQVTLSHEALAASTAHCLSEMPSPWPSARTNVVMIATIMVEKKLLQLAMPVTGKDACEMSGAEYEMNEAVVA